MVWAAEQDGAYATDANVTYTMDVQYLRVNGNTAWFTGQVTSVNPTGTNPGIALEHWILIKVVDNGEPGTLDQIWGEDLTVGGISDSLAAATRLASAINDDIDPVGGPFVLNGGNIQVH